MSQFAICRTEKIKSWATLAKSVGHNLRTSNEDRTHLKKCPEPMRLLVGSDAFLESWKAQVEGMHLRKLQQGQSHTLAREFFLGMSPEWAESKTPEQIDAWAQASKAWLVERFGEERVKLAVMHLDEQTPHIAAYVVPLKADPKQRGNGWTLSDRALGLGGKSSCLSELQTEYAAAMKSFGLARGVKGSKATHQRTKEWRKQMAAAEAIESIKVPAAIKPVMRDRLDIEAYGKRVAKQAASEIFAQMKPFYRLAKAQGKKIVEQEKTLTQLTHIVEKLQPLANALFSLLEAVMGHPPDLNTIQGHIEVQKAYKEIFAKVKPQKPHKATSVPAVKTAEARSQEAFTRAAKPLRPLS